MSLKINADRLRSYMDEHLLSYSGLAKLCNIAEGSIGNIIKRERASKKTIVKLLKGTKIAKNELVMKEKSDD